MNALAKSIQTLSWLGLSLVLSGCNLGFVSFETNAPENFNGDENGDPAVVARNLSFRGPSLVDAGVCTEVVIQAEANDGSVHPVRADVEVNLALAAGTGAKFYTNQSACEADSGTSIFGTLSLITLSAGESEVKFFVRSLTHNPFTIVALSEQLGFNSLPMNVRSTPRSLVFTTSPNSIDGGRCAGANRFRVEVRDGLGAAFSGSNVTVTLNSSVAGTFRMSCSGTPITQVSMGPASRDFYFETDTIASNTITARVLGNSAIRTAQKTVTVNRVADNFELVRADNNENLRDCSSTPLTIRVRDSENLAFSGHGGVPVRIRASSGSARFYTSQGACVGDTALTGGATTLNIDIPGGSSEREIYFRATHLVENGSTRTSLGLEIEVSHPTDSHFVTQTKNVSIVRAPVKLAISGPSTVSAGVCSSGAFTASVRDAMDRVFGNAGVSITFEDGLGGTYYSDPNCSSAITGPRSLGSDGEFTFYFKIPTVESSIPLRIAASGNPSPAIADGTKILTSEAKTLGVRISGGPSGSLDLGKCVSFNAQTLDGSGNVVMGDAKTVQLSVVAGSGRFFTSQSGCDGDARSSTGNKSASFSVDGTRAFWFRPTATSSVTMRASISGVGTDDETRTVIHTPVSLALNFEGSSPLTVELCSAVFTVTVRDGVNAAFSSHGGITVGLPSSANGTYYSDSACKSTLTANQFQIAGGQSTGTFYIRPSSATTTPLNLQASATGLDASNAISLEFDVVPFALHTDFAGSGSQQYQLTDLSADSGVDVLYLANSKFVAVAHSVDGGVDAIGLVKFDSTGALDEDFGGDGKFRVTGTANSLLGAVPVKAVRSGTPGFFYVAATHNNQMILVRFEDDGDVDLTFGSNGVATSAFTGSAEAVDVVSVGETDVAVVGTVRDGDPSFAFMVVNGSGTVTQEVVVSDANQNIASAAAFDGAKLVIGGTSNDGVSGEWDLAVARVSLAGDLDTSFNETGFFTYGAAAGEAEKVTDVVASGDAVYAAGTTDDGEDLILIRVTDGGRDMAFGGSGAVRLNLDQAGLTPRLIEDAANSNFVLQLRTSNSLQLRRYSSTGSSLETKSFSSDLGSYVPTGITKVDDGQLFTVGTTGTRVRVSRHLP